MNLTSLSSHRKLWGIACFSVLVLFTPHLLKTGRAWMDQKMEDRRLTTPSTYVFPTRELAEIDRLLQARFAVPPTNSFGMSRIGARHEIFKAIGPTERQAIEALQRQKQEVVFYVAGREYLVERQRLKKYPNMWQSRMQGPIYLTQKPSLKVEATQTYRYTDSGDRYRNQPIFQTAQRPIDLPTEAQLHASLGLMLISNSSLDHTATLDGQTYQAGEWQVAAVPVRATDKSCVRCHYFISVPAPRLGDVLGIALYAFRSAAKKQTKTVSVPLPLASELNRSR